MYEYIDIKNLTNESPNKYVHKNCMNIQIVFTLHNGVTPLQHTHERIFLHVNRQLAVWPTQLLLTRSIWFATFRRRARNGCR